MAGLVVTKTVRVYAYLCPQGLPRAYATGAAGDDRVPARAAAHLAARCDRLGHDPAAYTLCVEDVELPVEVSS